MTRLEHSVVIQKSLSDVFALAKQVERYPEFLPGYLESRILERCGDILLLKRAALMQGKIYHWKSWVRIKEEKAIHFEQAEGPLQGMKVDWDFLSLHPSETRVTITHRFHIARPWGLAFWMERFIFKPKINAMAAQVVQALKHVCENKNQEVQFV